MPQKKEKKIKEKNYENWILNIYLEFQGSFELLEQRTLQLRKIAKLDDSM